MARPLCIEFAGALYHVTSRGDRRDIPARLRGGGGALPLALLYGMQSQAVVAGDASIVPQMQRRPPPLPIVKLAAHPGGRDAAIVAAYATGAYCYQEIAEHFGVHLATVGRIVRRAMR